MSFLFSCFSCAQETSPEVVVSPDIGHHEAGTIATPCVTLVSLHESVQIHPDATEHRQVTNGGLNPRLDNDVKIVPQIQTPLTAVELLSDESTVALTSNSESSRRRSPPYETIDCVTTTSDNAWAQVSSCPLPSHVPPQRQNILIQSAQSSRDQTSGKGASFANSEVASELLPESCFKANVPRVPVNACEEDRDSSLNRDGCLSPIAGLTTGPQRQQHHLSKLCSSPTLGHVVHMYESSNILQARSGRQLTEVLREARAAADMIGKTFGTGRSKIPSAALINSRCVNLISEANTESDDSQSHSAPLFLMPGACSPYQPQPGYCVANYGIYGSLVMERLSRSLDHESFSHTAGPAHMMFVGPQPNEDLDTLPEGPEAVQIGMPMTCMATCHQPSSWFPFQDSTAIIPTTGIIGGLPMLRIRVPTVSDSQLHMIQQAPFLPTTSGGGGGSLLEAASFDFSSYRQRPPGGYCMQDHGSQGGVSVHSGTMSPQYQHLQQLTSERGTSAHGSGIFSGAVYGEQGSPQQSQQMGSRGALYGEQGSPQQSQQMLSYPTWQSSDHVLLGRGFSALNSPLAVASPMGTLRGEQQPVTPRVFTPRGDPYSIKAIGDKLRERARNFNMVQNQSLHLNKQHHQSLSSPISYQSELPVQEGAREAGTVTSSLSHSPRTSVTVCRLGQPAYPSSYAKPCSLQSYGQGKVSALASTSRPLDRRGSFQGRGSSLRYPAMRMHTSLEMAENGPAPYSSHRNSICRGLVSAESGMSLPQSGPRNSNDSSSSQSLSAARFRLEDDEDQEEERSQRDATLKYLQTLSCASPSFSARRAMRVMDKYHRDGSEGLHASSGGIMDPGGGSVSPSYSFEGFSDPNKSWARRGSCRSILGLDEPSECPIQFPVSQSHGRFN